MSIYAKKQDAARQQKKFGVTDEKYLKRAEELLFGELAVVLEIPREKVRNFIADRLNKKWTWTVIYLLRLQLRQLQMWYDVDDSDDDGGDNNS